MFAIGSDDPDAGGKAHGLAVAKAAGLEVPPGFVVPAQAFRAALEAIGGLPATPDDAILAHRAAALAMATSPITLPTLGAGPFIVRSSATIEDRLGAAAAGVFRSRRDVAASDVPAAIRDVWASLLAPSAAAYLTMRGIGWGDAAMAVIVQDQIAGLRLTAYSRAPGDPERILVESLDAKGRAVVGQRDDIIAGAIDGVSAKALRATAAAARRLEGALGAPADVELVLGDKDRLWVVQARPIPRAATGRPSTVTGAELDAALAFSRAEPDVVWTWDASHNPAPLTAAQAGLVTLVEKEQAAGIRQRIVLGYLYFTRQGAPAPLRHIEAGDLARVYMDDLAPEFAKALDKMGDDLEVTLDAYVQIYRLYSRVLAPSLRGAADVALDLPAALRAIPGDDLAAAWDVGAPTYGETALTTESFAAPRTLRDLDDFIFARAQAGVRRVLSALARNWHETANDLASLPLDELRLAARSGRPPRDVPYRAAAARAELSRLAAFAPPFEIMNGRGTFHPMARDEGVLRGRGTGGRARGPVLVLDPTSPRRAAGFVLVCAAALPTFAPLLAGALALVVEHEGLLGHGAALARELGVPCVVGCVGALTALRDGDDVWVDAAAGLVLRLSSRAG